MIDSDLYESMTPGDVAWDNIEKSIDNGEIFFQPEGSVSSLFFRHN